MKRVNEHELFDNVDEVIDPVTGGDAFTVARDGHEVAELRPLNPRPIAAAALLGRWSGLPHVDPNRFREDVGSVLDASP